MSDGFIPKHGGYEHLLTYQKAVIIYDATLCFCHRYIDWRSRTHDQMVQAARSGKQNIIEASVASGTSKETEVKLTNVARASLEELLEDYRDFLRTGGHEIWDKNSRAARAVRRLAGQGSRSKPTPEPKPTHPSHSSQAPCESYETYRPYIESRSPETVANILICLIHQTTYLLARQLQQLQAAFIH